MLISVSCTIGSVCHGPGARDNVTDEASLLLTQDYLGVDTVIHEEGHCCDGVRRIQRQHQPLPAPVSPQTDFPYDGPNSCRDLARGLHLVSVSGRCRAVEQYCLLTRGDQMNNRTAASC